MHRDGQLGSKAVQRRATAKAAELRTRQAERRASRIAQEMYERHRDKVEAALLDALRSGTRGQKIKAAEVIAKLAMTGERMDVDVGKAELQHQSREELIALLAGKLTTGPAAAILRQHIAQSAVIEGSAAEVVELRSNGSVGSVAP